MHGFSVVAPDLNSTSVKIIELLFHNPRSTVPQLREPLGLSEAATGRAIKPLVTKGIVLRNAEDNTYCLNADSQIARFEASFLAAAKAAGIASRNEAIFRACEAFVAPHALSPDHDVFMSRVVEEMPYQSDVLDRIAS